MALISLNPSSLHTQHSPSRAQRVRASANSVPPLARVALGLPCVGAQAEKPKIFNKKRDLDRERTPKARTNRRSVGIAAEGNGVGRKYANVKAHSLSEWEELGLLPNAPVDMVKVAFRSMARVHDPKSGGNEVKFKRIHDAYDRLLKIFEEPHASFTMHSPPDSVQQNTQIFIDQALVLYDKDDLGNALNQLDMAWDVWEREGASQYPKDEALPNWVRVLAETIVAFRRAGARELAAQNDLPSALLMYRTAQDMNDDVVQCDHTSIYILNQMAQMDSVLKRHRTARARFEDLLIRIERLPERNPKLRGEILANLAGDYIRTMQFFKAMRTYDVSLQNLVEAYAIDEHRRIKIKEEDIAGAHFPWGDLSLIERARNDSETARKFTNALQSLKNISRITPRTDSVSAVSHNVLLLCTKAMSEAMSNKTDEIGISELGNAIMAQITDRGLCWGLVAKAWGLGVLGAGNKVLAQQILQESLDIIASFLGKSIEVADTIETFGLIQYEQGMEDEAMKLWITAYNMYLQVNDGSPESLEAAQLATRIGALLIEQRRGMNALDFLSVAAEALVKIVPSGDQRLVRVQGLISVAHKLLLEADGEANAQNDESEDLWIDAGWGPFRQKKMNSGIGGWNHERVMDWVNYVGLSPEATKALQRRKIDGTELLRYEVDDMMLDGISRKEATIIRRFLDQGTGDSTPREKPDLPPQPGPQPRNIKKNELHFDQKISTSMYGKIVIATYQGEKVSCKLIPATLEGLKEMKCNVRVPYHPHLERPIGVAGFDEYIILVYPLRIKESLEREGIGTEFGARLSLDPLEFIQKVALPSVSGLRTLHAAKMIHRSISASNVVCGFEDRAMLTDWEKGCWDVASVFKATRNEQHAVRWLAPEALAGNFSAASDVWSLAVTWNQILEQCERPYNQTSDQMVIAKLRNSQLRPQLAQTTRKHFPKPFAQLFWRMTCPDPEQRPTSAEVMRRLQFLEEKLAKDRTYGIVRDEEADTSVSTIELN
mmetsp:Transcript_15906/g.23973  ORF Transcript_15906/g.23973 Transcript_15906/m.23973 type:complete len:1001 (+) Transcript_15906:1-3003(+)